MDVDFDFVLYWNKDGIQTDVYDQTPASQLSQQVIQCPTAAVRVSVTQSFWNKVATCGRQVFYLVFKAIYLTGLERNVKIGAVQFNNIENRWQRKQQSY